MRCNQEGNLLLVYIANARPAQYGLVDVIQHRCIYLTIPNALYSYPLRTLSDRQLVFRHLAADTDKATTRDITIPVEHSEWFTYKTFDNLDDMRPPGFEQQRAAEAGRVWREVWERALHIAMIHEQASVAREIADRVIARLEQHEVREVISMNALVQQERERMSHRQSDN